MNITKDELQMDYDKLNDQFISLQSELEGKNNRLSEYKSQLALVSEREKHYIYEIELLQLMEQPEVHKLKNKFEQLQEEFSYSERQLNLDLLKHNEELVGLQDQLKLHSENIANNSDSFQISADDIPEDLPLDVQVLRDEVYEKQLFMDVLEEKNMKLAGSIKELQLELEQVKENVDYKKLELVEASALMNDLLTTKTELESLKGKSAQSSTGNSLFAEVNDRRLELQETLISLKQKCNEMREQVSTTQKQMSVLRLHNDELLHLLKHDPLECLQDYETLITTYKDYISVLGNLSGEYKILVSQRQKLLENGLPNNGVEFINNIIAEKRKTEEKLNEVTNIEFRAQKMMSLQLKETNLKVQEWNRVNEQLRKKLVELEDTVQNLKLEKQSISTDKETPEEDDKNCNSAVANDNEVTKSILKVIDKHERILSEHCEKENFAQVANAADEKKVTFTVDTVDPKPSNKHPLRKGGKVLQCKTVYIPSIISKK